MKVGQHYTFRYISKYVIFSCIPLILVGVSIEVGLRIFYYQSHSQYPLAIVHAFQRIQQNILKRTAEKKMTDALHEIGLYDNNMLDVSEIESRIRSAVYSEEGIVVREYLQTKYEAEFKKLLKEVQHIQAKLLILYIPAGSPESTSSTLAREFFQTLAHTYNLAFIDPSAKFAKYEVEEVRLYPQDAHLSRYGNHLLTDHISKFLIQYDNYRASFHFQKRPRLFGDLKPRDSSIWDIKENMPFQVMTNQQGLRMNYEITFPKTHQRILILGDSFTFGVYLHNHDLYPTMLDRKYPDKEVINAGVYGYTISDELALFRERAQYVEPDLVILQVCPNDLSDLLPFQRSVRGKRVEPSEEETAFLKRVLTQKEEGER